MGLDKFSDECGIVGVVLNNGKDAARIAYFGLNGVQHRGQESTGIAVRNEDEITCFKDSGLVTEVFNEKILSILSSDIALGHTNHFRDPLGLTGSSQPFTINYGASSLSVAFNGGFINAKALRQKLGSEGVAFTSNSEAETFAICLARNDKGNFEEAIIKTVRELKGGYAVGIMKEDCLYGVRDPLGIRPLAIGAIEEGYLLASESCAFDLMDGELIRDVQPGEIVKISREGITSIADEKAGKCASCIFEYVYFARPDSTIDGVNVFLSRERAGRILAEESPVEADLVIGVPDSGTPVATGFAAASGIPYSAGMIKDKYVGRTYIVADDKKRAHSIRLKFNPVRQIIEGKRIVIVDDSIVRGTTMRKIISTIKSLGAVEVHLRISSPPILHSCFYGVETPEEKRLIANNMSKDELAESLGADSLEYISIEGLKRSVSEEERFCTACFDGNYPVKVGVENE